MTYGFHAIHNPTMLCAHSARASLENTGWGKTKNKKTHTVISAEMHTKVNTHRTTELAIKITLYMLQHI